MDADDRYILVLQVVSLISVVMSLAVVATYLCFKSMRCKIMMQLIACIALSNLLADVVYVVPFRPESGTFWCGAQAFLTLSCYPMAWMWTTVVTYFLFSVATRRVMPSDMTNFHVLCWGLPVARTLLMLPLSALGRCSRTESFEVCNFKSEGHAVGVYHIVTFYGLLLGCFVCIAYFKYKLVQLRSQKMDGEGGETFRIVASALRQFPRALVICWVPRLVMMVVETAVGHDVGSPAVTLATILLKIGYGIACAIILFVQSIEARQQWSRLLFPRPRDNRLESTASEVSVGDILRAVGGVENALHLSVDTDTDTRPSFARTTANNSVSEYP